MTAPSLFLCRPDHEHESNGQHHLGELGLFQFVLAAGKPLDPSEHHLCGLLPPQAARGCGLHRLLPPHFLGVHDGKRRGVFHRDAQQKHAHRHQPVYSEPRHQRPVGWHLLHADDTGGQHHNRSEYTHLSHPAAGCPSVLFYFPSFLTGWPFGSVVCKVSGMVQGISVSASVFTLVAIAVDR